MPGRSLADLSSYFDTIDHDRLMQMLQRRITDRSVLKLIQMWLRCPVGEQGDDGNKTMHRSRKGTPQGGVTSPLLSNIYLNDVDKMLERAKAVTRQGRFTYIEYARFADDMVILVDGFKKWEWLLKAAYKRLSEEFERLGVQMSYEKTRIVDLSCDETFVALAVGIISALLYCRNFFENKRNSFFFML